MLSYDICPFLFPRGRAQQPQDAAGQGGHVGPLDNFKKSLENLKRKDSHAVDRIIQDD